MLPSSLRSRMFAAAIALSVAVQCDAAVGLIEVPAAGDFGPLTVLYPTAGRPTLIQREGFSLSVAVEGPPDIGAGRLVVISHGSPASPWVYSDLAHSLVTAGFTVVFPEHYADNSKDSSEPGPPSWRRRPLEVSNAIDRLQRDARFARQLDFTSVGMYGMSAGGHTALTLAGGRWSPSRLRDHCQNHLADDFATCAGPSITLTGGILDGPKKALVRAINDIKLNNPSSYSHTDARIKVAVAGVPFAVDFDPNSFSKLTAKLGIISARKDRWLVPKYHSDFVLAHCKECVHLLDLPTGAHGALLSPLFPNLSSHTATLIGDPPDFDRSISVPRINTAITSFFKQNLGVPD